MKSDIQNRDDIKKLVGVFYEKLLKDAEFEHIFLKVAQIDVVEHLVIIVDFWESVLFQVGKYKRNTLKMHLDLNQKYRLKEDHYSRWLNLFEEMVDELFEGEKANNAKSSALSIATIIKIKIDHLENQRLGFNN